MSNFKSALQRFSSAIDSISSEELNSLKNSNITDFSEKKREYKINLLKSSFKELFNSSSELDSVKSQVITDIKENLSILKEHYNNKDFEGARQLAANLMILESTISYPHEKPQSLSFKINNLPKEISDEANADLNELERCFKSDCFRASIILCARLLEVALHRKYYEATKNDLLEKAPGIGLGSLIAKMKQENISLDPAISQQIHLINQVRIYSVHTKKEAFYPTKEQTQAIILYTIDIIRKLFS